MKQLNITLNVSERDDLETIETDIVTEAARQLVSEVFNNRYEHYGKTFKDLVTDRVIKMLEEYLDTDMKTAVVEKAVANVSDRLAGKVERTNVYRQAIAGEQIDPDAVIKTGLTEIISSIVRSEMKKAFK